MQLCAKYSSSAPSTLDNIDSRMLVQKAEIMQQVRAPFGERVVILLAATWRFSFEEFMKGIRSLKEELNTFGSLKNKEHKHFLL